MPALMTSDQRRQLVSVMVAKKMSTVAIANRMGVPISIIRNDRLMLSVPNPSEVAQVQKDDSPPP